MIELVSVSKTFKIPKSNLKKKKNTFQENDPREDGKVFHAVRNVSFQATKGRILGLLGPNGAGKTTVLRMLSTAIRPTLGSINLDGIDALANPLEARRKIGFLTGNTGLYERLSVREMVAYFGTLHGLKGRVLQERMDQLFQDLDMTSFTERRCNGLSFGMKQKANIARTLIHDPDILVLDEPTTGLDVAAAEAILELIERCRALDKTILFSTHHMHEVDRLCDDILILNHGVECFRGTVDQMRSRSGEQQLDKAFLNLIGEGAHHAA